MSDEKTKDALCNEVYDIMCRKGGYEKLNKSFSTTIDGQQIIMMAIYISDDDSSPLKMIDSNFHSWDLFDYLNKDEVSTLLKAINN